MFESHQVEDVFSSSDAKSVSVHRNNLSKGTESLSSETKQPESEDDYSLLSVADVKHWLCHIALHSLCILMAFISTNLLSRFYVLSVMHCIRVYHITFYETLPF
jgi:hypothetical protein